MQGQLCRDGSGTLIARTFEGSTSGYHTPKIVHFREFSFLINFITNPFSFKMYLRIPHQVDFKAYRQMKVFFLALTEAVSRS